MKHRIIIAKIFFLLFILTSLAISQKIETQFNLEHGFPDPSNPTTKISYSLPEGLHVILKAYDRLGRVVSTLVDQWQGPGTYTVTFSAANLSSGMYFINLRAGRFNNTKRIIFLK